MNKSFLLLALWVTYSMPVYAAEQLSTDFVNNQGEKIGTAIVQDMQNGTLITIDINLPEGAHAFHIHQKAACDAPDFTSAGGHFNPENHKHGFNSPEGFHAGDLTNLHVDSTGHIISEIFSSQVHLTGKDGLENGTALVIHEKADDYSSDPSGNAGKRIACAVIKD